MKKFYLKAGVATALLLSAMVYSQQNRITEAQVKPIQEKLRTLGAKNPAAAIPLDQLTKEEYALLANYRIQQQEDKTNPYGITEQELKNRIPKSKVQHILDRINALPPSVLPFPDDKFTYDELWLLRIYELQNMKKDGTSELLFNKSFVKNARTTNQFGTLPLVPPLAITNISTITNTIYCDDIAGDGKLYGIDNTARTLVRITPAGTVVTIGNLGAAVPTADTTTGLSWNAATDKMYLMAANSLYTVDLSTGLATAAASITGLSTGALPIWLEIDNAGNAFLADIANDELYKVNLTTGAATLVGPLGVNLNFAQEADFNRDTNELYMAAYVGAGVGGIYKVNTTTGAATLVGDTTALNAEFTMYSIADAVEPPPLDKAFVLKVYPAPAEFGTIPLTPPHTITSIAPLGKKIYADDLAGDGNLYGLDNDTKMLVKIYADGSVKNVGSLVNVPTADTVTGLSWNRTNNTMYAASTTGTTGKLYTVNLTTGVATAVGTMTNMQTPIWLEIDNNGVAYSADITTDKLYSVNLTNGAATEIGPLGIDIMYAQDADFNTDNNKLYMAGCLNSANDDSGIYEVNLTTGAATLVGATTPNELAMFTITNSIPLPPPIPPVTCGDNFTDSGGPTGNYSNSEDITTVIQPQNPGEKVKITFTQVEIESSTGSGTVGGCWDYMSIYDGPSISSPVLAAVKCGRTGFPPSVPSSLLSVGDSFTSTDASGKLTIRFRSDGSLNYAGWQANVTCAVMAVDETTAGNFSFYPNPTTGILNIASKGKVESLEVINIVGQKVMTLNPNGLNSQIDMSRLSPGVYLVKATVNGKVFTNKVIKK